METITEYLLAGYRVTLGPVYKNSDEGSKLKVIMRYRHFDQATTIPVDDLDDSIDDTILLETLEDLRGKLDYARNQIQF